MASSSKLPPPKKEPLSLPPPPPPPKPTDPPSSPPAPSPTPPTVLSPPPEDSFLAKASHLTRKELLRRRLRHVKQLSRVYRDHFWALMEECRAQHRDYYWRYGVSPFQDDDDDVDRHQGVNVEGCGETNANNNNNNTNCGGKLGLGFGEGAELKIGANNRCTFVGCKFKAMALTSFCHLHILSDPNQQLYKSCSYVIKSAQAGPIVCGKPILRSTVPSLCSVHFQKAQKHVTRALRKAGLNSSSTKLAPKFHVIVTEYVRQIQAKRRASQKPSGSIAVVKEECVS